MTTDDLWQAVVDAPDLIARDEACRTYVDAVLSLDSADRKTAVMRLLQDEDEQHNDQDDQQYSTTNKHDRRVSR